MKNIKPCPFCGKEPILDGNDNEWTIACTDHHCAVSVCTRHPDLEKVVEQWNTRAGETGTERVAHWDINCDGYYPFCSACGEQPEKMTQYCGNCGARMITRGDSV